MFKKLKYLLPLLLLAFSEISVQAQTVILQDSIIRFASNYLNTPYRRGGISPKAFDCSGFSCFVYKNFGYQLNRSSCDQAHNGFEVERSSLKPGDLVLFKGRNAKTSRVGHVGIVVQADGNGGFTFIHASVHKGVMINHISDEYYRNRYITARRIIEQHWQHIPEITPIFPEVKQVITTAPSFPSKFIMPTKC